MPADTLRDLVDAILGATPLPPGDDPHVIVAYEITSFDHGRFYVPKHGPARPVAARQAAAMARWLADHAINPAEPDGPWWTAGNLRDLAGRLDAEEVDVDA